MIEQRVYKELEQICAMCKYGMSCWQCLANKTWQVIKDPNIDIEVKKRESKVILSDMAVKYDNKRKYN